jgi:ankyrin repeat protein
MIRTTIAVAVVIVVAAGAPAATQGQRLIDAVKTGDRGAIKTLMRTSDVNAADAGGTTALHWASQNGDVDTVKALIRAGAGVNTKNRYGVAPLWLAASNGSAAVVEVLLQAGAAAKTTRADSGETVLMAAAMGGHVPVLRLLLAAGADPNTVELQRQQTALMWAAAEKYRDAARVLVEAGANIEAKSSSGLTPLMFAIRVGDIAGVTTLLDLGANLKATALDGTTMLGLAMINAHWELAQRLIERGADPNTDDPRGRPLHILALMRRADNRGLTPFLPRKADGDIGTIDLAGFLLARGAKINDRLDAKNRQSTMAIANQINTNFVGATPLYIASWNCDVEFVKFLLANGADPNITTEPKVVTPLLAAAGVGYSTGVTSATKEEALETVKLLAAAGNDLKATANLGKSMVNGMVGGGWNGAGALHGAVIRGATELVKWLVAQGVPLDLRSETGHTALDLALGSALGNNWQTWPDIAEFLEKEMRARGMAIRQAKYTGDNPIVGDKPINDEAVKK